MVLRHFLFLSSVTPTLKVDLGPGSDSPAELFSAPWGTLKAGSVLPSFWKGGLGLLAGFGRRAVELVFQRLLGTREDVSCAGEATASSLARRADIFAVCTSASVGGGGYGAWFSSLG